MLQAGIGRTGSLVALELALQTALAEKELSMPTVIKQLRGTFPSA